MAVTPGCQNYIIGGTIVCIDARIDDLLLTSCMRTLACLQSPSNAAPVQFQSTIRQIHIYLHIFAHICIPIYGQGAVAHACHAAYAVGGLGRCSPSSHYPIRTHTLLSPNGSHGSNHGSPRAVPQEPVAAHRRCIWNRWYGTVLFCGCCVHHAVFELCATGRETMHLPISSLMRRYEFLRAFPTLLSGVIHPAGSMERRGLPIER